MEGKAPYKSTRVATNMATFFDRAQAQALHDEVKNGDPTSLHPRRRSGVVLAYVLSACIYLSTLVLFIGGLTLLIWTWPNWLGMIVGGALAIGGWFLLPKPRPEPDHPVLREHVPTLYALADDIAAALDTRPVDIIALDPDETARFSLAGKMRPSILTIGLPLWHILRPQERVAMIAHELAHQDNGDVARKGLIGDAMGMLQSWHAFLSQPPLAGNLFWKVTVHGLYNFFALLIQSLGTLLVRLFWSESQRAEYLADYRGSRVSGTAALIAANDRLLHVAAYPEALFDATMQTTLSNPRYGQIFDRFATLIADIPADKIEATRARADAHHEDGTHPPTAYRASFLVSHPCPPLITCDETTSEAMDAELKPLADCVGQELVRRWEYHFN